MKLLLIEPEQTEALSRNLNEAGFVVDATPRIERGTDLFRTGIYDLVVVDAKLASENGFPILNEIARKGRNTLAVALTPKDAVDERIQALEIAADACLIKPFVIPELLATIRSLLRRGPGRRLDVYQVSDLEVDVVRHHATRAGKKLELTPKEFALLSFLIRRAGETVTRAQISEQVWETNFDCDTNIVDVHIRRLRSKLDDPFEEKLIHTVRGLGYVLSAAV